MMNDDYEVKDDTRLARINQDYSRSSLIGGKGQA
jgi:hypothetical protein